MRIGILTFHFAYNYGAMLQVYSLKQYIESCGHEVEVIPYYPDRFKKNYDISPFIKGISLKNRIGKAVRYYKKKEQTMLFEEFKKEKIFNNDSICEFDSKFELKDYCKKFDMVIYGSDQIWNNEIEFNDSVYFGDGVSVKKISYAASMGKMELTDIQKRYIHFYLKDYDYISVREPQSQQLLKIEAGMNANVVCDPVFLNGAESWRKIESSLDVKTPFMLVYLLENNVELLQYAKEKASENNLLIYGVHPTVSEKYSGVSMINKVGPREFLYLIDKASCVCTNSFHAVCFAAIFKKNLLHIPNSYSPERTLNVLEKYNIKKVSGIYNVDFSKLNGEDMINFIDMSKLFLENALNKND